MLSKAAEKALDHWIKISTWCTNDLTDSNRWYMFVDQYQRDHGFTIDEPILLETIEAKTGKPKIREDANEELRPIIQERISLAVNILEFLECTGR